MSPDMLDKALRSIDWILRYRGFSVADFNIQPPTYRQSNLPPLIAAAYDYDHQALTQSVQRDLPLLNTE
jgi:hypothetical protein